MIAAACSLYDFNTWVIKVIKLRLNLSLIELTIEGTDVYQTLSLYLFIFINYCRLLSVEFGFVAIQWQDKHYIPFYVK